MSDYTKITDFSAKDPLASGDPEKLAVGADVDAEYDAIAVAIATKEDSANKGAASGYCPLDGAADVPDENLSSDIMRLDTAQTITSGKGDAWQAVTPAANTYTPDLATGNSFTFALAATNTIANPTNPLDGQTIVYKLVQDGTGSRTVTWGSKYLWGSATAPTLSTGPADIDVFSGKYNETDDAYYMTTVGLNFG
jgi:hypothetical protein